MPTDGKYFVLKHAFENVSCMKECEDCWSEIEEHFGVKWRINVRRYEQHLAFFLSCLKSTDTENWSIEAQWKQVLISNLAKIFEKESNSPFVSTGSNTWGWNKFIKWEEMEKTILWMTS